MKNKIPEFEVGDIVLKRVSGTRTLKVERVSAYGQTVRVTARYEHSGSVVTDYERNFVLAEKKTGKTGEATMNTLYKVQLEDRETYGVHIGTDSQGRFLIEEKGSGGILVVAKTQLEEVLPFTFSVRMNGKEVHFQGEAGKVKKGDILLYTGGGADNFAFAVVKLVDTKSRTARAWEGVKVVTEAI